MNLQFSSVQSLSPVQLFVTPWTAACQVSLSITNSWSLLKLMSIESVMPSNHLILCRPLLLPPSIFPSIRIFFNESVLCIRWPKYQSLCNKTLLKYSYTYMINILHFILGKTGQCEVSTRNGIQFTTYELLISAIFHLIFSEHR